MTDIDPAITALANDFGEMIVSANTQPRLIVTCPMCSYSIAFSVPKSRQGMTISSILAELLEHHTKPHEASGDDSIVLTQEQANRIYGPKSAND
jgi:hypothetical protein